jgi:dUTP pyrophosphatase
VRRFAGDELGPGPRGEAWSGALAIPAKGAAALDAPSDAPELPVRRLDPGLPLPAYAHPGDAGADLRAAEEVVLPPGGRATVGTGVAVAVPDGYAGFVHPRSGLASRHGITVVNAPGTIDAGYRGEVRVVLLNTDPAQPFTVRRGDRIAQLVVQPVTRVRFLDVAELPPSPRGEGGFGSTGR